MLSGSEYNKPFRILSIDGGGIRGIIPARFLCDLESEVGRRKGTSIRLCDYFDLICGTSTGGIIAIGLALGMSAREVLNLYKDNASKIFGNPNSIRRLWRPKHSAKGLKQVLQDTFKEARLGEAQTRLCIPAFDLHTGKARVFKTSHHEGLFKDYHIPAYQVALATSAAPIYFPPFSGDYFPSGQAEKESLVNHIDGGIYANNPTLIGIYEALYTLKTDITTLKVLSLGTGTTPFNDSRAHKYWGWGYWRKWLVDVVGQAQTYHVENMVKYLCQGAASDQQSRFHYERIQFTLSKEETVSLDTTDPRRLDRLEKGVSPIAQEKLGSLMTHFFTAPKEAFTPFHHL